MPQCRIVHATPNQPGAIAIIQLIGECLPLLHSLTGIDDWPIRKIRLEDFDGIDEGLAGRLTDDVALLMPHGGPRVVQKITERLIELGAEVCAPDRLHDCDPLQLFPEATDRYEAIMLSALARAQSPLAIDLLLDQPSRWRAHTLPASEEEDQGVSEGVLTSDDLARSQRLNHLINPPTVVLAGCPNVGKSTLSNALLGRPMSIALDRPGTTRDYTAGRIDFAGLVANFHDTPGMRDTDDDIEAGAIDIARRLIEGADLVIAMRDPETDWPDIGREPDLYVLNKIDLLEEPSEKPAPMSKVRRSRIEPIGISALTGDGMSIFVTTVRDALVSQEDLTNPGVWLFDEKLLAVRLRIGN